MFYVYQVLIIHLELIPSKGVENLDHLQSMSECERKTVFTCGFRKNFFISFEDVLCITEVRYCARTFS